MPEFIEYPKWMAHPNAVKSVPVQQASAYQGPTAQTSALTKGNVIGTVEKFPPVQVLDADQEAYYASRGYEPAGKQNPWANGAAGAATDPSYTPEEYPKWVGDKLVNNATEEEAALGPLVHAVAMASAQTVHHIPSPLPKPKKDRAWSPERRAAFEAKKAAKVDTHA